MNQSPPHTDVGPARDAPPSPPIESQPDRYEQNIASHSRVQSTALSTGTQSSKQESSSSGSPSKSLWAKMKDLRKKDRRSDDDATKCSSSRDQASDSEADSKATDSKIPRPRYRSIHAIGKLRKRMSNIPQNGDDRIPIETAGQHGSVELLSKTRLIDDEETLNEAQLPVGLEKSGAGSPGHDGATAASVETLKQAQTSPDTEKSRSKPILPGGDEGDESPHDEQVVEGTACQLPLRFREESREVDPTLFAHQSNSNGSRSRLSRITRSASTINLRPTKPVSKSSSSPFMRIPQIVRASKLAIPSSISSTNLTQLPGKALSEIPTKPVGLLHISSSSVKTPIPAMNHAELASRSSSGFDPGTNSVSPGISRIPVPPPIPPRSEKRIPIPNARQSRSSNSSPLASPSTLRSLSATGRSNTKIPAPKSCYKRVASQDALSAATQEDERNLGDLDRYASRSTPNLLKLELSPVPEALNPFPDEQTRRSAHRQILSGYFAPCLGSESQGDEAAVNSNQNGPTEPASPDKPVTPLSPIDEPPSTVTPPSNSDPCLLDKTPATIPEHDSVSAVSIQPLSENVSTVARNSPRKVPRTLDIRSIRERTPVIPDSNQDATPRSSKFEPKSCGAVHLVTRAMSATGDRELLKILVDGPPQDGGDIIGIPYHSTFASDAPTLDSDSERPPLRNKRSFTDLVKMKLSGGSKENLTELVSPAGRSRAVSQSHKRERSTSRERSVSQPMPISEVGENVQCEARAALDADFTKFVSTLPADHEEEIQRHMRTPPSTQPLRIVTVKPKDVEGKGKEVRHDDLESSVSSLNQRLHVKSPTERRAIGKEKVVGHHQRGASIASPNESFSPVSIQEPDIKGKAKEVADYEELDSPPALRVITNIETDVKGKGKEVEPDEPQTAIKTRSTDSAVPMTYLTLKPKVQNKICWVCDKPLEELSERNSKIMRCTDCKSAFYCSSACRRVHKKERIQHQAILTAADKSAAHVLCTRKTTYPDGYFAELLKRWHVMEACIQQTVSERKLNSFVNGILTELAWTQATLHGDLQNEDWALFMESAFRALFNIPRLAVGRGIESQHPNHNMHRKSVFLACVRCYGTCDGCGRKCCVMNSLKTEHRHAKLFGPDFQAIGEIMATIDAWYRLYTVDPATFVECVDCKETGKQYQYCPWCFNMCAFESETAETSYEVRCIEHHDKYLEACGSLSENEHADNAAKMREWEAVHPSERAGGYLDDYGEVREEWVAALSPATA